MAELLVEHGLAPAQGLGNITTGLSALSGLRRPLDLTMDVSLAAQVLRHTRVRGVSEYLAALATP